MVNTLHTIAGEEVQSLVREQISHMPRDQKRKKKERKKFALLTYTLQKAKCKFQSDVNMGSQFMILGQILKAAVCPLPL